MNKFIKYILIPGLVLGASVGATYGVTAHFKNQELDKRYQAGYESALSNEAYYKSQLETFQKLVDEQSLKISDFTTQVEQLTKDNEDKALQISNLNVQLSTAKTQLESLETDNELKSGQISTLTSTVSDLQNEVIELQQSGLDKDIEISQLNTQISNLQLQISTLQTTITLNNQTIESLNTQIGNYQTQIANLQQQIANNANSIKDYSDQISALQKTIAYLESYIDSLVSENQSVVRFMYNGSVYNMQIINNGSTAMVTNPEDTNYIKFNYWMINNLETDPTEYVITEETEFVANLTYYYDVKFMNIDTPMSSQIIVENGKAEKPSDPTRTGYTFKGWSIDGVTVVDPTTVPITDDTIFTALWVKVNTVTFNDGTSSTTQSIETGDYPSVPATPTKDGYRFLGWSLDGSSVIDPTTVAITEDTTFTALWEEDIYGLFSNNERVMTWNELIDGNYFKVVDGQLSRGNNYSGGLSGELVVPSSVSSIASHAFTYKGITKITLPNTITNISDFAFAGCDGLKSINIPSNVTSIGSYALYNLSNLSNVVISEGVQSISNHAFYGCTGLINISIPSSVTSIGGSAFDKCSNLQNITLSEGLKDIEYSAFSETAIINITIPASVETIGNSVFADCSALETIQFLGNKIQTLASSLFLNCSSLTEITIPSGITSINSQAFSGCKNLSSVVIPSSVTTIGSSAFFECLSLRSIIIPSNVISIEKQAFYACSNLYSVTFEDSNNWFVSDNKSNESGIDIDLTNPSTNANYLISQYVEKYWTKS